MAARNRNVQIILRVSPKERDLIDERMRLAGINNLSAYLRKAALEGYILRLDMVELREMISLLRRCSNSLNQIAKRANETHRIYETDLKEVQDKQERLWQSANEIVSKLASIQ